MKDHTGREINLGDRAIMDAGHAHCDDHPGTIVMDGLHMAFRYDENGDIVRLTTRISSLIEIVN